MMSVPDNKKNIKSKEIKTNIAFKGNFPVKKIAFQYFFCTFAAAHHV